MNTNGIGNPKPLLFAFRNFFVVAQAAFRRIGRFVRAFMEEV
jgi:hypothetical protein